MPEDEFGRAFYVQKITMSALGMWPLEKPTAFATFRWIVCTTIEVCLVSLLIVEMFFRNNMAGSTVESILFLECATLALAKNLVPKFHAKKLAKILRAVSDDYGQADPTELRFLKKRARAAMLTGYVQMCAGYVCLVVYVSCILLAPPTAYFDPATNGTVINKDFIVPSTWISFDISNGQFILLAVLHSVQTMVVTTRQGSVDTFFLNITLHLCTKFEMLRKEFVEFGHSNDTVAKHRKNLGSLVRKHARLISLAENIEDSYNVVVLLQLVMSGVLIGLSGFGVITSIRLHDNLEMMKNIFIMNFMIMQSVLYTYTGDMLQRESESVLDAIYDTVWYKLPATINRDLVFVMMRANIPIRLTGGKFFYVSRAAMMNILKTAGSYISVLQVAMQD